MTFDNAGRHRTIKIEIGKITTTRYDAAAGGKP